MQRLYGRDIERRALIEPTVANDTRPSPWDKGRPGESWLVAYLCRYGGYSVVYVRAEYRSNKGVLFLLQLYNLYGRVRFQNIFSKALQIFFSGVGNPAFHLRGNLAKTHLNLFTQQF